MISVFIVDDHNVIREGIIRLIKDHEDLQIVGESEKGLEAIELVQEIKPDVILMDISLGDINGIEASKIIISKNPGAKIVILSVSTDYRTVDLAVKAGVHGYVTKKNSFKYLADAIRTVVNNKPYFSMDIVQHIMKPDLSIPSEDNPFNLLDDREKEMFFLLLEGKNIKEIADIFHLGEKTIYLINKSIEEKFNTNSVLELYKYAIKHGLISI